MYMSTPHPLHSVWVPGWALHRGRMLLNLEARTAGQGRSEPLAVVPVSGLGCVQVGGESPQSTALGRQAGTVATQHPQP